MKLTTHLHSVPRLICEKLYLCSSIRLYDVMLNQSRNMYSRRGA